MKQSDYLRLLDSGVDNETIAKILAEQKDAPTEPLDWRSQEHLETDFVSRPPMDIQVQADVIDQPPSQRLYGAPLYDQNGDMHCRCCGRLITRSVSTSGEGIASCANTGCPANGFAYAEGSFTRNPHRVLL